MHSLCAPLLELFRGSDTSYGGYNIIDPTPNAQGKIEGQATYGDTGPTLRVWNDHLTGVGNGLGCIPVSTKGQTQFGAIDIDVYYGLDLVAVATKIQQLGLPLIVCRSKSGGAHCYVFFSEPVSCKLVRNKLATWRSILNFGGGETYPIQNTLAVVGGSPGKGNFINMPYFDEAKTVRYAVTSTGKKLTAHEFVDLAYGKRLTLAEFNAITVSFPEPLDGAPPCLQVLCSQGFGPGSRNNGLFALGVYCKKSDPDNWVNKLIGMNQAYMDPPLDVKEVENIIKSLEKKEYFYPCLKPPISNACNSVVCRSCKYGIGNQGDCLPTQGTLIEWKGDPPIYTLCVEGSGEQIDMSIDELLNYSLFQRACLIKLGKAPVASPKKGEWLTHINQLFAKRSVVPAAEEHTAKGQLKEMLKEFLNTQTCAKELNQLLIGRPVYNKGVFCFRYNDFAEFLNQKKYKELDRSKILQQFKRWEFKQGTYRTTTTSAVYWETDGSYALDVTLTTPDLNGQAPY